MALPAIKEKEILAILKDLPPGKLNEVLDFAEYLKTKEPTSDNKKKTNHFKLPTFHMGNIRKGAFDRDALYGKYLDQKLD